MPKSPNPKISPLRKGALNGFCKRREMTIQYLAATTGVSRETLYHLNHGRRAGGSDMAIRIANVVRAEEEAIAAAKEAGLWYVPTDDWKKTLGVTDV